MIELQRRRLRSTKFPSPKIFSSGVRVSRSPLRWSFWDTPIRYKSYRNLNRDDLHSSPKILHKVSGTDEIGEIGAVERFPLLQFLKIQGEVS